MPKFNFLFIITFLFSAKLYATEAQKSIDFDDPILGQISLTDCKKENGVFTCLLKGENFDSQCKNKGCELKYTPARCNSSKKLLRVCVYARTLGSNYYRLDEWDHLVADIPQQIKDQVEKSN